MRLVGCEGILFWCTVVLSLQGWLGSTATAADLSRQRLPLYSWRWACTEEKEVECAQTARTCKEPTGECVCELPKKMEGGRCTVCTKEKEEDCAEFGMTCEELTGACVCIFPKRLENGTCIDPRYPETPWFKRTTGTISIEIPHVSKPPEDQSSHKAEHTTAENHTSGSPTEATFIRREQAEWGSSTEAEHETAASETTGTTSEATSTGSERADWENTTEAEHETVASETTGTTSEPVCGESIKRWCAEIGMTCQETTGKCVCRPGKLMIDGICTDPRYPESQWFEETTGSSSTEISPVTKPPEEQSSHNAEHTTAENHTSGTPTVVTSIGSEPPEWKSSTETEHETAIPETSGTKSEPVCGEARKRRCAEVGMTCQETTGKCVCRPGTLMIDGICKEPVCGEAIKAWCADIGMTCQETTGKCVCRPGKLMIDGICTDPRYPESQRFEETTGSSSTEISPVTKPPEEQSSHNAEHRTAENHTSGTPSEVTSNTFEPPERLTTRKTEPTPTWPDTSATHSEATSTETEPPEWDSGPKTQHATAAPDSFGTPSEASSTMTELPERKRSDLTEHTTARPATYAPSRGTGKCSEELCKRPRCHCASDAPPAGVQVEEMPQFVMLTFDGAVNVGNMAFYRELLDTSSRKNKQNGCGIAATFFTSAEYLDYEAVNQLHSWGNEIALKSISHRVESSYWQTINTTQWEREVLDQRAMLRAFANVPGSDVTGFRGPFLITGGDQGFQMLHKHFRYDSTLIHQRVRGERPFYPYTMDFGFRRSCNVWPCPEGSYPGLWVLPINVMFPKHTEGDLPCAMADACLPQPVTAEDTFEYFRSNFEEFYTTNRAPFPVFLHEAYLKHPERKAGYLRFVDWLLQKDDVYLVTASEVLRFMEDPEPLKAYAKRPCAGRKVRGPSTCPRPTTCSYKNTPPGGERYMRTCSRCPKNYPWVNNPLGN